MERIGFFRCFRFDGRSLADPVGSGGLIFFYFVLVLFHYHDFAWCLDSWVNMAALSVSAQLALIRYQRR